MHRIKSTKADDVHSMHMGAHFLRIRLLSHSAEYFFSKFVVAPQVRSRRWGDTCGTEVEEIAMPRKENCCELLAEVISVKRKQEERGESQ